MNILAFVNKDSSPAYHRIILPLLQIDVENVQVRNDLHTEHFKDVDIFVYNRILPTEAVNEIYNMREHYGFKIGVDVDDYWILDATHPYKNEYTEKNFANMQMEQLQNADFVTVTHERLLGAVKPFNKNIHILPNAIPQVDQFINVKRTPHPKGLTRLFWQGSSSHLADVAQIREAIATLDKTNCYPLIEMVLAGYEADALIWHEIAKLYTDIGKIKHSLIAPLHYDYYYHLYEEADICLVPLRTSLFNSMKSNLKVLEAANLKLPVIASKTKPYLNLPVTYAENSKQWVKQINDLVLNPAKQKEQGEKLHEYCKEHFNFNKINTERKQIYQYYNLK